jgi:hypothetical protein
MTCRIRIPAAARVQGPGHEGPDVSGEPLWP